MQRKPPIVAHLDPTYNTCRFWTLFSAVAPTEEYTNKIFVGSFKKDFAMIALWIGFLATSNAFVALRPVTRQHVAAAIPGIRLNAASVVSSNKELLPGIEAIDKATDDLVSHLESLTAQPFFRYYSVDILASCEYMPQELFECYTESCEIYPEDEGEVSPSVRTQSINQKASQTNRANVSSLKIPSRHHILGILLTL